MLTFRALTATALAVLALPPSARAGLHYSGEQFAELPSRPSGFLTDHRALRAAGYERPDGLPSPLRDDYLAAAARLEKLTKARPLTADEAADLGAVHLRLGRPDKALNVLAPTARKFPTHYRLASNLGTAFQLSGDLPQAAIWLDEAVTLAPDRWKPFERAQLKLVTLRHKEGKAANNPTAVDDLFGATFAGPDVPKLPADALIVVQQLGLWLPADPRLLWLFGEVCHALGDVRPAAAALDGCVTEFALAAPDLRARRLRYRAAADELAKKADHDRHRSPIATKSTRPLIKAFDELLLPAIEDKGANPLPWPVLGATVIGPKGRPAFVKHLDRLDGKTVTLTGFMQPVRDELAPTAFLLLEYPVGCWFCEVPDPTGMLNVELKPGKSTELRKGLIKVTGTLRLNRADPEGYLFSLTDARVGEAD